MTFSARLDRWVLATTLLSTLMFFIASEQAALGLVAAGLVVIGFLSISRRDGAAPASGGARHFVLLLNALTLGLLGYAVLRVSGDRELLVESVGDLLAWSLVIRVFDPRGGRRRGLLLLMSVFSTLAAVLTSNSLLVGVLLFAYAPVATWTIMLHQLAKGHETTYERVGGAPALIVTREATRRLRSIALKLTPAAVALSFVVYVLMPRGVGADMLGEWQGQGEGATTGFTDRVLLQRSGQLASSDETVMDVVMTDARGGNIGSTDRPVLLRGAVLDRYDPTSHAWVRDETWAHIQTRGSAITRTEISRVRDELPLTTYRVTLRNKDTDYLFAPMRPVWASLDRDTSLEIGVRDLVLLADRRDGRMSYSIESAPEWAPSRMGDGPLAPIAVPERVTERAREIIQSADIERDPTASLTEEDGRIARTIENYFRREGVYSTEMTPSPSGVDPIEHFVYERMSGHCEQFASAMAAMLRGLGISARVVTGFRAHEFNDIAGHYTVRQRDAHAWVEVRTAEGVWQTFDPSPVQSDPGALGAASGVFRQLRQMYEAVEHLWVVYVVSFDEQMKQSLFERLGIDLREATEQARRADTRVWRPGSLGPRLLRAAGAGLVAFALTAALLYAAGFVARLFGVRFRIPGFRPRLSRGKRVKSKTAIVMERRFARAMDAIARAGFERPIGRGAIAHAEVVRAVDAPLGDALRTLSAMHYAARFGGHAMNEVEIGRADALVTEIERGAKRARQEVRRGRA
jgi:transglutaminase-like putative cysteine protease